MKESLARALSGGVHLTPDDATQPPHERPVDRIGAVGFASRRVDKVGREARRANLANLGKSLYALKYANRQDEYPAAHNQLADMLKLKIRGISQADALHISRLCIREWVIDVCIACSGKKQVADHDIPHLEGPQPMKPCTACSGTGFWRYSDHERATFMEMPLGAARGYFPAIEIGASTIRVAVAECLASTRQMLERW